MPLDGQGEHMNEQESNICEKCGGIKQFWYKVEMLTAEQVAAQALAEPTLPDSVPVSWRFCPGHPEQHLPHKYCPKCEQWRDLDGMHCGRCGTTLVLRRLDEHPEPTQKHDGKLDDRGDAIASYGKAYLSKSTKDVHIDGYDDGVCLSPKQALSLLAWLRQEEATLEQLAKEQASE